MRLRNHFAVDLSRRRVPFNLGWTLDCGQVLRWRRRNGAWRGVVDGAVIQLKRSDDGVEVWSSAEWVDEPFLARYFRWDDPLPTIYRRIAQDATVRPLATQYHGLRLVRQDPWECLATYTCATFKNIPAIQRIVEALARRFGDSVAAGAAEYAFPSANQLARASLADLRACGTGFRARYLHDLARRVALGGLRLDELRHLSYAQARTQLLEPAGADKPLGLGPKVADCVLLFALDKLEAFPIDIWIGRAILRYYAPLFAPALRDRVIHALQAGSLSSGTYETVAQRLRAHFWPFGGYAQQLLYHELRSKHRP